MEIVVDKNGDVATLHLTGNFGSQANLTFRNAYKPLLDEQDTATIAIDLGQVPYMDSSALGLLILLREQAQSAGKQVTLCRVGPELMKVFAITQLHKLFHIE